MNKMKECHEFHIDIPFLENTFLIYIWHRWYREIKTFNCSKKEDDRCFLLTFKIVQQRLLTCVTRCPSDRSVVGSTPALASSDALARRTAPSYCRSAWCVLTVFRKQTPTPRKRGRILPSSLHFKFSVHYQEAYIPPLLWNTVLVLHSQRLKSSLKQYSLPSHSFLYDLKHLRWSLSKISSDIYHNPNRSQILHTSQKRHRFR
jgi:hypothetical protein